MRTLLADLPLPYQVLTIVVVGAAVFIVFFVAVFLIPELWRAGRDTIAAWLAPDAEVPDDARTASRGGAAGDLPALRPSVDRGAAPGSDVRQLHVLSPRVGGMGPVRPHQHPRVPARIAPNKGPQRRR